MPEQTVRVSLEESCVEPAPSAVSVPDKICEVNESVEALKWPQRSCPQCRLQQKLLQAQRTEALGTLAGGIAHDFNNLLGVILGFASIVRLRLAPSDPLLEFVKMIEESAQRGSDLTRQLLGLARQGKCESVPIRVGEVLSRVVKIITSTFDRRIQVQTRTESGPLWVDANPAQLEQAILNLCINARDAMPEGGVLSARKFTSHTR